MKFKIKSTNMFAIVALIVSAILMISAGLTFAWFTDQKTANATLTFGKVEITANDSSDFSATVTNVMPGQVLLSNDVAFSVAQNSATLYPRVKIDITTTSTNTTVVNWLNNNLIPAIYSTDNIFSNSAYQWLSGNDGYYYLYDKQTTPALLPVSYAAQNSYIFIQNGLTIPLSVEPAENNAQYNASLSISIKFQAIQSANLPSTALADVKTQFGSVFGFDVVATAGANGTISPASATVNYGASQTFTITANADYEIDTLTINGVAIAIAASATTYTISNVQENKNVVVTFKIKVKQYTKVEMNTGDVNSAPSTWTWKESANQTTAPIKGEYVKFGKYDYTTQSVYEDLIWQVINVNADGTAELLLTRIISDTESTTMYYRKDAVAGGNYSDYKTSDIRAFLNGSATNTGSTYKDFTNNGFLQRAFSTEAEQDIIQTPVKETEIYNSPETFTFNDKIYLLSKAEADALDGATNSQTGIKNDFFCCWWLRSPYSDYEHTVWIVTDDGDIGDALLTMLLSLVLVLL